MSVFGWHIVPEATEAHLGLLPLIFLPGDPRDAEAQINDRYAHGGGAGYKFPLGPGENEIHDLDKPGRAYITYPEDRPFREIARRAMPLTDQTVILFEAGMVAYFGPNHPLTLIRMD